VKRGFVAAPNATGSMNGCRLLLHWARGNSRKKSAARNRNVHETLLGGARSAEGIYFRKRRGTRRELQGGNTASATTRSIEKKGDALPKGLGEISRDSPAGIGTSCTLLLRSRSGGKEARRGAQESEPVVPFRPGDSLAEKSPIPP